MIAYEAETAMVNLIRSTIANTDKARALLQQIYKTYANIYPDYINKKLIVEIHSLNYRKDDKILLQLFLQLNYTKTEFPGTDIVLHNKMGSAYNPKRSVVLNLHFQFAYQYFRNLSINFRINASSCRTESGLRILLIGLFFH
jgi:hypothetical protein